MKFNEQELHISVPKKYAKPYAQKIKNILWTRFEATAEVEDWSFDGDEEANISIYFLSTEDQCVQLIGLITTYFGNILRKRKKRLTTAGKHCQSKKSFN